MRRTMVWRNYGRVALVFHGRQSPNPLEWSSYLNECRSLGPVPEVRVLVYSLGGGPDGRQRKEIYDTFNGEVAPTAILTNNLLVRAMGVAFGWINPKVKILPLDGDSLAFDFLGLSAAERAWALQSRRELERELASQVEVRSSAAPPL